LTDTKVTDAGVASFRDMKKLVTLELGGTGVTDDGLRELKRLKGLTFVDIARTKVTKAGADGLRGALPNLQIAD
jgi:TolB-like protein